MAPLKDPFAPGAGTQPPELVGREHVLQAATCKPHMQAMWGEE